MTEGEKDTGGFGRFMTKRIVAGIVFGLAALWVVWFVSNRVRGENKADGDKAPIYGMADVATRGESEYGHTPAVDGQTKPGASESMDASDAEFAKLLEEGNTPTPDEEFPLGDENTDEQTGGTEPGIESGPSHAEQAPTKPLDNVPAPMTQEHGVTPKTPAIGVPGGLSEEFTHGPGAAVEPKAVGVTFVEDTIAPLDYELNERFWGWRRNDLIRVTDNVENMQLGILEVVRRTSVVLLERLSRHGVSASIDKNLENAMNWLMINSDRYWLPSAEEKYNDSLKELRTYADRLEKGEARFFVRADNLIPLLLSLAELAGSCDENLVKAYEEDGSPVGWTTADDYFYYAKGVAIAMGEILHGVSVDFASVLEARQGVDLLNRAMHTCHVAAGLDPWIVTEGALDGILANHRANMAAEISHLRYFLNALATALAT